MSQSHSSTKQKATKQSRMHFMLVFLSYHKNKINPNEIHMVFPHTTPVEHC